MSFVAFSNREIKAAPKLGKLVDCHACGKRHRIRQDDAGKLQTIRCGGHVYLVGIDGRDIR